MISFTRSLAGRVFLLSAAIVAVAILIALSLASWIAADAAEESAIQALSKASASQQVFEEQRFEKLRLIARLFVSDPYLSAYYAEAIESGDPLSILDLLGERQSDLGFDFAIALDAQGRVLTRTDAPGGSGQDLSSEPLIASALGEFEAFGTWRERDELYSAVAVPIASGSTLSGFLVAGFALDDRVALEMHQAAGADVVLISETGAGLTALAATLDRSTTDGVLEHLKTRQATGETFRIDLGGQRWIGEVRDLLGSDSDAPVRVASLVSLDAELEPFSRVGTALIASGLLAVVLSSTALFLLARKALAPLLRLSEAVRSAIGGRYNVDIRSERSDEVGELARSFRRLLGELREKRDMVDYLAKLSRSVPADRADDTPRSPLSVSALSSTGSDDNTVLLETPPASQDAADATGATSANTQTFGERFQLLSIIGEGGMGVVYKARDRELDDLIALKTLKREFRSDPEWEKLKEELKFARKITHPNVMRTYDFGNVDGVPFISMEYVRGVTLRYLLRKRGKLPYSAGLHLSRQLCRGLEAVHAQGVLHRDIKPGNLLVEPNGNARLMDFGVARQAADSEKDEEELGMIVGTPDYLAPEQVEGREPSPQSDIYACGLVMFEIFTAERPFVGDVAADRMLVRLEDDPLPPQEFWPEIPRPLVKIIEKTLAKTPDDRYGSVAELLKELEALRA